MPVITVQTAQGPKRVTVPEGTTPEQLEEVADEVAAQFSTPEPAARGQQAAAAPGQQQQQQQSTPAIGGFAEMTGVTDPAALRGITSGVAEAGARFYDRYTQLKGAVKDAWGLFVGGKAYMQDDRATGGTRRLTESSQQAAATATALMRQQAAALRDADQGADPKTREGVAQTAQLAAAAFAPEALLPRAVTILGAAGKNAASAAIGTGAMFDKDSGEVLTDAAVAAGVAPLAGLIPSAGPAVWNRIGRYIVRAEQEGNTQEQLDAARRVMPDFQPTLAQALGVPELVLLERRAYNSKLMNFYADQSRTYVQSVQDIFTRPVPGGASLSDALAREQARGTEALRKIRGNAMQAWDDGMAEAARIERGIVSNPEVAEPRGPMTFQQGGVPGRPQPEPAPAARQRADIGVENLRAVHKKWMQDANDKMVRGTTGMTKAQLKAMDEVLNWNLRDPKRLSASDLDRTLRAITAMGKNDPVVAMQLREALDRDLDVLAQQGGGQQNAVVDQILEVRAMYKREMAKAEALSKSMAFRFMGIPDDAENVSAEDLVNRFTQLTPGRQTAVRKFMEGNAPDMLVGLRNSIINQAVRGARVLSPAADAPVDAGKLMDQLFDPKSGYDLRTSGLWGAEDLKKMDDVKAGFRVIANSRPSAIGTGTPITPEDVTINLISMHSAFIGRQATRMLMSKEAWRFFTDPNIMEQLRIVNRTTTGTPANMLARVALLDTLSNQETEEE